ncbi:uncharacterized protein (DUF4213/DUF364 family) [Deinococcus sp. HSC-46F16]|uniref:hypothetical protein n=1 Tax=Deinococcus sp. HSC-46F16 TaxID=2910968 RepID=UPI0020A02D28|nr:hypothetical protein [Deinococcus sp. HSC-46F16]MCP2014776.1 uncharacterized protein (DUF4213/DUF364 family) [Deinococcus sp. HSC-46F16]
MNRNSFLALLLKPVAALLLAALGVAYAQPVANVQVTFERCEGTIEQRVRNTERGVSRFQVTASGQVSGRASTAAQVFELSVLAPGASRPAVYRTNAVSLVRPSRDVYVLTASLVANNTLMNYALTLPANSRNAAILVATDAAGNALYRGTCRWTISSGRLP